MKIFDTHTRCFPDALAPKALPHLASVCGSPYYGSGTYNDLKEKVSAVGGCGALIARCIKKAEVVAYPDLGAEAIHRLEVENFPVTVNVAIGIVFKSLNRHKRVILLIYFVRRTAESQPCGNAHQHSV